MGHIDLLGIAALITAITNTVVLTIALRRQRTIGQSTNAKLDVLHTLTNGQSLKLEAMAHAAGVREGGDEERANPTEKR